MGGRFARTRAPSTKGLHWAGFTRAAPRLAVAGVALFDKYGVVLVGTVRKNGAPRISPVEPIITSGRLYLGMMPGSLKTLDLRRDPRCTVHAVVADRMAKDGEFKLHGRVVAIAEDQVEERRAYAAALQQKIGWDPGISGYDLYAVQVASAALWLTSETERVLERWRIGEPSCRFRQGIDGVLHPLP